MVTGLFFLVIAFSTLHRGSSGPNGSNDGGNLAPTADCSDYVFEEPAVSGRTYVIDPVNGSASGDGSSQHP